MAFGQPPFIFAEAKLETAALTPAESFIGISIAILAAKFVSGLAVNKVALKKSPGLVLTIGAESFADAMRNGTTSHTRLQKSLLNESLCGVLKPENFALMPRTWI
jgi:hypothetical protein